MGALSVVGATESQIGNNFLENFAKSQQNLWISFSLFLFVNRTAPRARPPSSRIEWKKLKRHVPYDGIEYVRMVCKDCLNLKHDGKKHIQKRNTEGVLVLA